MQVYSFNSQVKHFIIIVAESKAENRFDFANALLYVNFAEAMMRSTTNVYVSCLLC